jgi:D-3-phosphoglycerate dehydrogenase
VALDVLETEPPVMDAALEALLSDPRVIVTPHIAGYSHESFLEMSRVVLKKLGFL